MAAERHRLLLGTFSWIAFGVGGVFAALCLLLVGLGWRDMRQRRHLLLSDFDRLRALSGGKPTGLKYCIGHPRERFGIVKAMRQSGIVLDFVVVDGAEG